MRRRWQVVPPEVRNQVVRLSAQGKTFDQIRECVDVSAGTVHNILEPLGGVFTDAVWEPSGRCLSLEDRVEIRLGIERGESLRSIAQQLGRAPSTVSREVERNGGRAQYRPVQAHRRAHRLARRPKQTKLAATPQLCRRVVADLERLWSPEQISRRLAHEFPDRAEMQVSHETIYKSLYVQGRGELRRELSRCLRSGRAKRRTRRPDSARGRGRIADMVNISERPAETVDRAVPGHWEGDLIIGKDGASAVGTLVERSTRFVMLVHLPAGRTAPEVRDAIVETVQTLPGALWRSITWDQGSELAEHVQFRLDTGINVYFCDPHSPWQRGSNENTNGLLRQYLPKSTDLSVHSREDLDRIADSLNGRPRKTLGWMTPAEKLAEVLAHTTT